MNKEFKVYKPVLFFFKSKEPALTIAENGILYNSYLGNLGLIKWSQIKELNFSRTNPKSINIILHDFDSLKNRLTPFKRKMSELYFSQKAANIIIFQQQINIPLEQLYDKILSFKRE
ncbi:MAG TPA: STM3941 family protein [Flavobacterium sp.]|jgi:hypothetical protein